MHNIIRILYNDILYSSVLETRFSFVQVSPEKKENLDKKLNEIY